MCPIVQSGQAPFLQCVFGMSTMIVLMLNLFLSTPVAQVLVTQVGKQTKRCEIVIHKFMIANNSKSAFD